MQSKTDANSFEFQITNNKEYKVWGLRVYINSRWLFT